MHSLGESLDFWCRLCGFTVLYDRPDEGFAYIAHGTAHVMLEEEGVGRNWVSGALDRPLGRGVNLQVSVASLEPSLEPITQALQDADWPLFMEPEEKWYRTGESEAGVEQLLVQDQGAGKVGGWACDLHVCGGVTGVACVTGVAHEAGMGGVEAAVTAEDHTRRCHLPRSFPPPCPYAPRI